MELRPWTLPNLLTLARLCALPFILIAILEGRHETATVIFLAAAITDGVDGYVARRFGMTSPLGAYLDPLADKLFLVSTFVVLALPSTPASLHIPVWLVVLTISRDVLILLIALLMYLVLDVREFPPSPLGKTTTVVEISTLVAVLLANSERLTPLVAKALFTLSAAFIVASGIQYVWRVASRPPHARPAAPPKA